MTVDAPVDSGRLSTRPSTPPTGLSFRLDSPPHPASGMRGMDMAGGYPVPRNLKRAEP
jgi:hypothetical protein